MDHPRTWARLRVTPSGPFESVVHTAELQELNGQFVALATEEGTSGATTSPDFPSDREWHDDAERPEVRRWSVEVPTDDAQFFLETLRSASVPAFPESPTVCDGAYVEITIKGNNSDLTLGWWSEPPEGAKDLADFAYWLYELVLPSEDGEEEED